MKTASTASRYVLYVEPIGVFEQSRESVPGMKAMRGSPSSLAQHESCLCDLPCCTMLYVTLHANIYLHSV